MTDKYDIYENSDSGEENDEYQGEIKPYMFEPASKRTQAEQSNSITTQSTLQQNRLNVALTEWYAIVN